ncbi:hypothetical protein I317_05972 [Kwoniella heveanensis CBS 569]|uniref:Uncharacterized protein n=1 Tax=Kwoniella heveanensis BCC8398 TaxID=1296120 RepID=A0A1B9GSN2_9TREE|nr:hypothetical protein I316_04343 [Kwoniella heveanensis BCC8398]OCF40215.1 hypothetical protein I317_05972 [Kwoniella heveanensis CBS 569]
MPNPLDEPNLPTPRAATPTFDPPSTAEPHHPLAIEAPPPPEARGSEGEGKGGDDEGEITTLDLGEGNVVKLDKLGPMIINSDGTLSRIQNWQDLHPIEQERTVRLLVKKRNVVRLQKLADDDNGGNGNGNKDSGEEDFRTEGKKQEEKLSILQDARHREADQS